MKTNFHYEKTLMSYLSQLIIHFILNWNFFTENNNNVKYILNLFSVNTKLKGKYFETTAFKNFDHLNEFST